MGNLVAIVGRPNVGKSTLFNRLTKTRQAIVNEQAGTTRDRQYGKSEWLGREFSVVDTGGWVVNSDDIFEGEIRKQVMLAVEEAVASGASAHAHTRILLLVLKSEVLGRCTGSNDYGLGFNLGAIVYGHLEGTL